MAERNDPKRTTPANGTNPDHPDVPDLGGATPSTEELTGRASKTGDSLAALFENDSAEHFADGFRGGSDDDKDVSPRKDDDTAAEEESETAV